LLNYPKQTEEKIISNKGESILFTMLHIKISNARAEIYISQPTKLVEKNTVLQLELECIMQSWAIKWVRGLKDAMNLLG